jgi:hypothetical protein
MRQGVCASGAPFLCSLGVMQRSTPSSSISSGVSTSSTPGMPRALLASSRVTRAEA